MCSSDLFAVITTLFFTIEQLYLKSFVFAIDLPYLCRHKQYGMKDFFRALKQFVPPYKRYMGLNIVFNVLSAILNVFSFALIIPILKILFKMDERVYSFIE